MSKKGANDNVRVMVRVRPFNKKETDEAGGSPLCTLTAYSDTLISCVHPTNLNERHDFPFDWIFWSVPKEQVASNMSFSDQPDVYQHVGVPSLDSAFSGYNGCIFAYGQTSSGKTHSMTGYADHGRGVIPRLCEEMFGRISASEGRTRNLTCTTQNFHKIKHFVTVSYLEIYNEKVLDLLGERHGRGHDFDNALQVVHDPKLGPIVLGLTEIKVSSWE